MAKIGAKGGAQRAYAPARFILAREAARASWMPEARAKRLGRKRATHEKINQPAENKV